MEQGRNRQELQERMSDSRTEINQARQDITQRETELRKKTRQIAEQELAFMTEQISSLAIKLKKLETQANTQAETIAILVEQSKEINSEISN